MPELFVLLAGAVPFVEGEGASPIGVPGASLLGPLAVPTQITAAVLAAPGTPRRWVLLWQAVAIALWTTATTALAWGMVSSVVA